MSSSGLPSLLPFPVAVRESDDAGHFYCGHTLFCTHALLRAAHARSSSLFRPVLDDDHAPLWGFLHVPPRTSSRIRLAGQGHTDVTSIAFTVAAALAGYGEVLERSIPAAEPLHIALSGFGPFRDVVENPSGHFVTSAEEIRSTLQLAFSPVEVDLRMEDRGLSCRAWLPSGRLLHLVTRCFEVDDRFLEFANVDSLFTLLAAPTQAWLGLGVCRDPWFRVETHPHDGGLLFDEFGGRHVDGRPIETRLPPTRALVKALFRGTKIVAPQLAEDGAPLVG